MRQLNTLGWMHNRARMIVASFLTKHLLIDWREGERYFMSRLIDGDLAANNGGWQWAASTGTDAQPYFRIFNPITQSEKFDSQGRFIRYWLPELRDVPDGYIHAPWTMDNPPKAYPPPIVEHSLARQRALTAFSVVKSPKEADQA
jgi:deoxyribodipyrimidine photo-lyase